MVKKLEQSFLPFKIERTDEPLIARAGLVLPYEMARVLKLPEVIDGELPPPGSGRGYKSSQFVMPLWRNNGRESDPVATGVSSLLKVEGGERVGANRRKD